jgi:CRISPR-associated endonuclease/helicase Cas3
MPATFDAFFHAATGNKPYDYQRRLAGGDAGRACESQLISIPTGLGKTAAVMLTWRDRLFSIATLQWHASPQ